MRSTEQVASAGEDSDTDDSDIENDLTPTLLAGRRKAFLTNRLTMNVPIHIGGTAGTGKSAFALFLLHVLMQKYPHDAFVYRHGDVNPGCFLHVQGKTYYHPSIVHAFSESLWLYLLTKDFTRPIWTILDGAVAIPTGTREANLIVLTSPGQQSTPLKHFLKYAVSLVNPPWTLKDVQALRKRIYPHLTEQWVQEEYLKWGGVPRILLDWADDSHRAAKLEASIYTADSDALFRQAGLADIDHANVSGVHFHLVPGEKVPKVLKDSSEASFRYAAYNWASTWLENRFWETLKDEQGEISIMRFLLDRNNASTARAYAFEPHVFRTMENAGIKGQFKLLLRGGEKNLGTLSLGPHIRQTFYQFADISDQMGSHDKKFFVPMQTNHASCDFYVPNSGLLVQVTVGQKHGVKYTGLMAAVDSGIFNDWKAKNRGKKLRLVFLVDKYNYLSFRRQPYLSAGGSVLQHQGLRNEMEEMFSQYAWQLDVQYQLEAHLIKDAEAAAQPSADAGDWSQYSGEDETDGDDEGDLGGDNKRDEETKDKNKKKNKKYGDDHGTDSRFSSVKDKGRKRKDRSPSDTEYVAAQSSRTKKQVRQ